MYYGKEHADIPVKNSLYSGVKTIGDLYAALSEVWCAETCAPRMRDKWSKSNMTLGQCSVTAFLVQDIFGGDVYGIPLGDGNYHCFNIIDGQKVDLTSEQFGDKVLNYDDIYPQTREEHFAKTEKHDRYELLKKLLAEYTQR